MFQFVIRIFLLRILILNLPSWKPSEFYSNSDNRTTLVLQLVGYVAIIVKKG